MLDYCGILLIADAAERAGSADRDKITQALAASTFADHVMPYGPTKFVDGQNQGAQPITTQVQKMAVEVIQPSEFASAKAVFPIPAA
jgi:branched-chain amino acid transport system substrate-binding protein